MAQIMQEKCAIYAQNVGADAVLITVYPVEVMNLYAESVSARKQR